MSELPDEIWRQILGIGIWRSNFTYRDLCCVSISCRQLHRLSADADLWSFLLSCDFPQSEASSSSGTVSSPSSPKLTYQIKFDRERTRKVAAHQRAVLRVESQIAVHSKNLKEMQMKLTEETQKMKALVAELSNLRKVRTVVQISKEDYDEGKQIKLTEGTQKMRATIVELSNLCKVRQASVALNVWQPEVIRGWQKQMVGQCGVHVDARINTLEMDLRVCRQQIEGFNNFYKNEKRRLDAAKERLGVLKYHPLQDFKSTSSGVDESNSQRKKLKKCCDSKAAGTNGKKLKLEDA